MATALDRNERMGIGAIAIAAAGFGVYGLATGAPSTVEYLVAVTVLTTAVVAVRRTSLRPPFVVALVALAIAHLAGGLVRVGDDVLYNTRFGSPVLQYDHLVHASAVLVATLALGTLFGSAIDIPRSSPAFVFVLVLAGLGLGAINEAIEFAATLAHGGRHVGGYENTGWDLVSNVVGALLAGALLRLESGEIRPASRSELPSSGSVGSADPGP